MSTQMARWVAIVLSPVSRLPQDPRDCAVPRGQVERFLKEVAEGSMQDAPSVDITTQETPPAVKNWISNVLTVASAELGYPVDADRLARHGQEPDDGPIERPPVVASLRLSQRFHARPHPGVVAAQATGKGTQSVCFYSYRLTRGNVMQDVAQVHEVAFAELCQVSD